MSLLVHAPHAEVEAWFPRYLGVCEAVGRDVTRLRSSTSNLDYFVLRISDHPFAMTVEEPPELRDAFARRPADARGGADLRLTTLRRAAADLPDPACACRSGT